MIRICHVQVLPLLSGVQRVMLEIFKHLDRDRYELHVVCQSQGPLTTELEHQNVAVHLMPSLGRAIHPWNDWQAYRALTAYFRKHRFDLVHTHSSKPGILGRLAAKRAGMPCTVHHVHAFAFHEFSSAWKQIAFGEMERRAASHCNHLLFVNHEERRLAVERGWIDPARCTTVYNGIELALYDPARTAGLRERVRASLRAAREEVLILFNGRLDYPKQPELLPEIVARLNRLRPAANWRLLVAGDGPAEPQIRRRKDELGLDHRISLLGWQDDSLPFLAAADIVIHTSLAEGLPLALIEAQAAALPAVASRAKGNREVVDDQTGILCPVRDVEAYAQALARLIDAPIRRRYLGESARQRAEQHFDTNRNMRQIATLYDRLLAAHQGAHRAPLTKRAA